MPRREAKKQKQPPFIMLDHNVQAAVAERLTRVARFRQIGEKERETRFQKDAEDRVIFMGPRHFLFVTHDQDFLNHDMLPNDHGGVLVFICPPTKLANGLKNFLDWWGPRRNLLRGRIFKLTERRGHELLRDGSYVPISRRRASTGSSPRDNYGIERRR